MHTDSAPGQKTLHSQSVDDFLVVEYQDTIGGRVHNGEFGKGPDGKPMVVEYGANWVQGLGTPGGPGQTEASPLGL
jgi:polyamine oxidase